MFMLRAFGVLLAQTDGAQSEGASLPPESLPADSGAGVPVPTDFDGWMRLTETYGLPALKALALLFVTWVLSRWARRAVLAGMKRAHLDATLGKFAGNAARWAVLALGIIAILGIFGVPTASFAAALASLGLAIGLALQGSLGNAAAGVMLLVFRPFKVGDVINAAGVNGKVNEIDLFVTTVDTFDNRRLIVPNGQIFGSTIENVTYHETRRVDVAVGVEYSASIESTRAALTSAARIDGVLDDPVPAIVLTGLGASSVDWVVRAWAKREDFWSVKERLTASVKNALDDAGIGIPFPQMDVHLDGELVRKG